MMGLKKQIRLNNLILNALFYILFMLPKSLGQALWAKISYIFGYVYLVQFRYVQTRLDTFRFVWIRKPLVLDTFFRYANIFLDSFRYASRFLDTGPNGLRGVQKTQPFQTRVSKNLRFRYAAKFAESVAKKRMFQTRVSKFWGC